MGPLLIDLVTTTLMLIVLYAGLPVVLGALIATVMLIPATLVTPHLHSSYATTNHLVILAAAVRIALMAWRGALTRDRFHATPVHLAAGLLLVVWVAAGLVFAPSTGQVAVAEVQIINLAFVLMFGVVVLALLRELQRPWFAVQLLIATLTIASGIAVIEHFTRGAYGHWLFVLAGHPGPTTAAQVLEIRAGHVRVRSSSEFALEFAWVAAGLLPLATMWALRIRRWLVLRALIVVLVALGIYWTYSRSAAAAIPIIVLLLAITVRDRRTTMLASLGAVGIGVLYGLDRTVRHHLSLATDSGSVGIRFQRLPIILGDIAPHAYFGLGLGGLGDFGFPVTDNFYLAGYAATGVIGAAVLVVLCATALLQSTRGLTASDPLRRAVIAASLVGFVAFLASGLFDDALLLTQSAELAFLLLALATATTELEFGFARMPRFSLPRIILLTSVGGLVGLIGFLVAPTMVSQERTFSTIGAFRMATPGDGEVTAPSLIDTICQIADAIEPSMPKVVIRCRDNFAVVGEGTLRVEAPTARATLAAYAMVASKAHEVYYLTSYATQATGPPIKAKQTFWRTAPASGAALGFAVAFIAPLPIRRRHRRMHL